MHCGNGHVVSPQDRFNLTKIILSADNEPPGRSCAEVDR